MGLESSTARDLDGSIYLSCIRHETENDAFCASVASRGRCKVIHTVHADLEHAKCHSAICQYKGYSSVGTLCLKAVVQRYSLH
jgi:hypothetical protein